MLLSTSPILRTNDLRNGHQRFCTLQWSRLMIKRAMKNIITEQTLDVLGGGGGRGQKGKWKNFPFSPIFKLERRTEAYLCKKLASLMGFEDHVILISWSDFWKYHLNLFKSKPEVSFPGNCWSPANSCFLRRWSLAAIVCRHRSKSNNFFHFLSSLDKITLADRFLSNKNIIE